MKYLITILLGGIIFGQEFNSQDFNSQFNTDLQVLQREIARQYTPKEVAFIGNRYFFEEPQPAILELYDATSPIKVLTNFNLIEETFEIETDWKPLSISSDKDPLFPISKVLAPSSGVSTILFTIEDDSVAPLEVNFIP